MRHGRVHRSPPGPLRTFSRQTSALALAGTLALAGAACSDDDPAEDPVEDVTDGEVSEPATGGTETETEG